MSRRLRVLLCSIAAAGGIGIMSENQTLGQTVYKTEKFCFSTGPATAAGNLVFKIVNRPLDAQEGDCTDTAIFGHTQNYDEVAGGANPTESDEVRDAAEVGLSATVPAGFTVDPSTSSDMFAFPCITITSTTQFFDICVDGFLLKDPLIYEENGLTVDLGAFEDAKSKIPTVSEWGLAVMAILVLTAGTVVVMRRRAVAST